MDKTKPGRQQGFLVITLIIIILIVGFVAAAIAYMLSSSGRSVGHGVQSNQALSLAEAGLSKGIFLFNANPTYPCPITVTTANPSCSISTWSSPETLGTGQFQYVAFTYPGPAWSSSYAPAAPTTTINSIISSSPSPQVVPVASVANFAPMGQIMVGSSPVNYLNYTGTSINSTDCNGASACFTGIVYSGASAISSGSTVTQNQTVLSAAVSPSSSFQTIRIASANNLAPFGQVIVQDQRIPYAGVSNDSTVCGGSGPCLVGAFYPVGPTLSINSRVSQTQLVIQARGDVPTLANPQGARMVASPLLMSIQCVGTNPGNGGGNNGNGCATNGNGCGTGGNNPGNGSNNNGNGVVSFVTVFSVGGWTELVN